MLKIIYVTFAGIWNINHATLVFYVSIVHIVANRRTQCLGHPDIIRPIFIFIPCHSIS